MAVPRRAAEFNRADAMRRFFRDPESVAEYMLGHMREDLDLTEEQIAEHGRIVKERHRRFSPAGDGPEHH